MDTDLYEQFIILKDSGRKAEAKVSLDLFIASFATLEQKRDWVYSYLEEGKYGQRIRHEIYENLVYPVLLDGYLRNDANSVAWLAKTANNLYKVKSPHPVLKGKHEFTLFKETHDLEPSAEVEAELLSALLKWFSYAQHEWPAGILYGPNGADISESEEYLLDVQFARSLDRDKEHEDFLSQFESKVREYIQRLQTRA